ncbi:adenylate/guanylate cyclase domain-containing protein [Planctomyces sp. SH-PL14]|uniref:adenylate/guanylate cyclase domain-containing protein n=1 Tax=Planctomyces sp. SH-PL14 TaxID=1632864 RepID=UPI00078CB734|nr:adenylate/guanylate cyclase domain-containing response regulator [Planctomyces sp. SH-PL14]AMV16700.1 Adenylate cyclase 2 [Planctomyces sp. SH-PL14]
MAKILVVDDEVHNREAMVRALGDENPAWEFVVAANEHEGEALLLQHVGTTSPIDVVLTDLVMKSEASGMTMLQRAREIDPHVMAILFTAKEKSLDRYAAFDVGAFDVVEKNIRGVIAAKEINIKARAALRYREWSRKVAMTQRYFDRTLYGAIDRDPSLLALSERVVTIVFWDIRGFSLLCEILKAHPTLIAGFLKEYCDIAAKIVFSNGGVLDKFIGDGVMALFGALPPHSRDGREEAVAACHAAQQFRLAFVELRDRWMVDWKLYSPQDIRIGLGCGIHTGSALVGSVGTEFRDQFTALGPHVNFAARIEGRSQGGQILMSQSTEGRTSHSVKTGPAGEINDIKNIPGIYRLFEIV